MKECGEITRDLKVACSKETTTLEEISSMMAQAKVVESKAITRGDLEKAT